MKHDRTTFKKVKNKKFVKKWKKAVVQWVIGATTYPVQYILPNGSLGNSSFIHHNRIEGCHTREEKDLWTDVQPQQERGEQGGAADEGSAGVPLPAPPGYYGGLQRSSHLSPPHAGILAGSADGEVSRPEGQADKGGTPRGSSWSSVRSPTARLVSVQENNSVQKFTFKISGLRSAFKRSLTDFVQSSVQIFKYQGFFNKK